MTKLAPPLHYFPVSKNPFAFKTGLIKLDKTVNTQAQKIFQIDSLWFEYHQAKMQSRAEQLNKYVLSKRLTRAIENRACAYIINTLSQQYPEFFQYDIQGNTVTFSNHLSDEELIFDEDYHLQSTNKIVNPPYENLLDALCCQLQEDFSLIHITEQHDNLVYLHLCFPNYWAAEHKIGKCFAGAHQFVPAMEGINKKADKLNKLLKSEGPFERFTWGITTDRRLNHHPKAPDGESEKEWYGRNIDETSPLYLRVERQVTTPFNRESAYLFSIRTYFVDLSHEPKDNLEILIQSIQSMPEDILKYKGIHQQKDLLSKRLHALALSPKP